MAPPPPRDPAGNLAAVLGILRVRPQHACPWQGRTGGVDRASSDTTLQSILSLVVLRQFEAEGTIRRCIAAIKKRQGEHETTIRELMINPGGVSIGEPLSRFSNILNGDGNFMGGGKRAVEA